MTLAIVREAIDVAALEARIPARERGGIVTFCGVVRDLSDDGRTVSGLFYEAYEPLALKEFAAIAQEIERRYGNCSVSIVHRVGDVVPGEIAVAVVVAAPHRAEAFDACSDAIEQLKLRAPIWKSERYADGASAWKENEARSRAHLGGS